MTTIIKNGTSFQDENIEVLKNVNSMVDYPLGEVAGMPFWERLVTARELGEILRVSSKTILSWSELGKIPHYKFGKGRRAPVRFDIAEIRAWMRMWYNLGNAEIVAGARKGGNS